MDKTVSENFIIEKESLDSKQLPETILKRHSEMVSTYKDKSKIFQELLNKKTESSFLNSLWRGIKHLVNNNTVAKVTHQAALTLPPSIEYQGMTFKASDFKRKQQAFDPNNLGTVSIKADKNNKPMTTKQK